MDIIKVKIMRKITIFSTVNHAKKTIESEATTVGELRQQLRAEGVDLTDMDMLEGVSHTKLEANEQILPHDIPYKGRVTNDLVIMLTKVNRKISNGVYSRSELYNLIKQYGLGTSIKEHTGAHYTNVSTDTLNEIVGNYEEELKREKEEDDESQECPECGEAVKIMILGEIRTLLKAIQKVVDDLAEDFADDSDSVKKDTAEDNSKKVDSPFSDDEINEMFE